MSNIQNRELYEIFLKHQDVFNLMVEEGVFELKAGKVTLNFNDKVLMNIEIMRRVRYK